MSALGSSTDQSQRREWGGKQTFLPNFAATETGPYPDRQVLGAKSVNLPFEQLGGAAFAADNLVSD